MTLFTREERANLGDYRLSTVGGTKGFNYNDILEYMEYLDSLGINYQSYFVGGIGQLLAALSLNRLICKLSQALLENFAEDF